MAQFCAAGWINDIPSGVIDQEELDKVLLGWGNSVAMGRAAAVPEPTTWILTLVSILAFALLEGAPSVATYLESPQFRGASADGDGTYNYFPQNVNKCIDISPPPVLVWGVERMDVCTNRSSIFDI